MNLSTYFIDIEDYGDVACMYFKYPFSLNSISNEDITSTLGMDVLQLALI